MSRSRFSRVFAFLLGAVLLFSLFSCAPDYTADARIGTYTDESGAYTLVFRADGTGMASHSSVNGFENQEEFVFEINGDALEVLGKSEGGGVLGRNEYRATFAEENGVFTFTLKNADSGNLFGVFYQKGN